MTTYKRYRWKRKVAGSKWVAHKNGWANIETLTNVTASNSSNYWQSTEGNNWKLYGTTSDGSQVQLRVPRSVREDVATLTKPRLVVSRYLKWAHATPEFSEIVEPTETTEDTETNENINDESVTAES